MQHSAQSLQKVLQLAADSVDYFVPSHQRHCFAVVAAERFELGYQIVRHLVVAVAVAAVDSDQDFQKHRQPVAVDWYFDQDFQKDPLLVDPGLVACLCSMTQTALHPAVSDFADCLCLMIQINFHPVVVDFADCSKTQRFPQSAAASESAYSSLGCRIKTS